jgi:hypothetical protein
MASVQDNPVGSELSSNDMNLFMKLVDKDLEWFELAIKRHHEKKKQQLSLTPDADEFSRLLKQEIEDEMQEVARTTFAKYLANDPFRKELISTQEPKALREFWIQLDFEKDFAPVYRDCLNSALQTLQIRFDSEKHHYTKQDKNETTGNRDDILPLTPTSSIKNKKRKNSDGSSGTPGSSEKRVSFSPKPQVHKSTELPYVDV